MYIHKKEASRFWDSTDLVSLITLPILDSFFYKPSELPLADGIDPLKGILKSKDEKYIVS